MNRDGPKYPVHYDKETGRVVDAAGHMVLEMGGGSSFSEAAEVCKAQDTLAEFLVLKMNEAKYRK